jgi:hypothetical protein
MHTRNPTILCVTLVAMLLLGMVARAVSDPPACAAMACCRTASTGMQQVGCPPVHIPPPCTSRAPCCDIDPLGSHQAPLLAASFQTHFRAIHTALQPFSLASDPLIAVERALDHYRYLPPWGGTIPVYLRTLTLLC